MTFGEGALCAFIVAIIILTFMFGPAFFMPEPEYESESDNDYDDRNFVRKNNYRKAGRDMQRYSDTGSAVLNANSARRYQNMASNLSGYSDYNSVMQYIGLEPEIYESHANYSSDMNRLVLGPSTLSERTDSNDTVPWIGLRRTKYEVFADENARVEQSETPDQMPTRSSYCI
jgi:hypothetical protein